MSAEMKVIPCCVCGITITVTAGFEMQKRDDQTVFYCPEGHPNYYPASESSEQCQINNLAANLRSVRRQLSIEYGSNAALRGQITRLKKRIVQGCCPFCGKAKFYPLWQHLESDHPAMVKKYGAKE